MRTSEVTLTVNYADGRQTTDQTFASVAAVISYLRLNPGYSSFMIVGTKNSNLGSLLQLELAAKVRR